MYSQLKRTIILTILLSIFVLIYACISSMDKDKINVFIVGDSTVKNGRGDGAGGLWGWGDPIAYHFDSTKVNVEKHALGGMSSRTYQTKGLWDSVLKKVQPGDYVLIQFGHNDGGPYETGRARASIKGTGNDSLEVILEATGEKEVVYTYGHYLRKYINDTKAKGATPIIISPIPRNIWTDNKISVYEESYPQWAKKVAEEENIPFIDLHQMMIDELEKCGPDIVTGKHFFKRDHTHTTAKGAVLNAHLVAKSLAGLKDQRLSKYIVKNPKYFFPGKNKIVIIGDSTVAKGKNGIQGWGEEVNSFFDTTKIDIINKARGGRSSRTYYYEGLWQEVLDMLQPGDYVFIQFGHNDGGTIDSGKMRGSIRGTGSDSIIVNRGDGIIETVHSYGWYLTKYIKDCKVKGVIPIVFSQIPRREWHNGKVERVSDNYGKWAKATAEQNGAYFVDLNEMVALKYEELGPEKVAAEYFLEDHTHTTKAGAILNAKTVTEGLLNLNCCDLKEFIL